ncbi:UDP-glucose 6-dehydrogenase TuaD [Paenibacillus sp. Leaf72]|uniref:UDP-glucose 6-dehydrogenase TuaD n=1 Tax=Paenibacillus sp. Leaf72 TaxID=1736234 RepID=UPI0006F82428|nr:UDP-glucose/GDP-mannose dehydrogenase family protein [Paenibacillus sp. Leaf72]KQO06248.1 UDP-glucose 6-dehydrogenase [Paenibacillus sp. Leaf72]
MKVTIIGTGYVGLVNGACFAEKGHHVICADINQNKIDQLNDGQIPIYEPGLAELVHANRQAGRLAFSSDVEAAIQASDIIYIAVGTPMSPTGEADLTYVDGVAETIGKSLNGYKVVVNKSTVPVGTGKRVESIIRGHLGGREAGFDVVSNPEFLREGTAIKDCMNMERAVIGAESKQAMQLIRELHEPFNTTIVETNIETAEMIKYASNAFLAMKISFINDISNICERVGANVVDLSYGLGLDSRIGNKFLDAGIGFGGSCFPKDTEALISISKNVGYEFKLIESVITTNKNQPIHFVQKIDTIVGSVAGKKIAVLGLAFKPETDDMRSAPSIPIIRELISRGAEVHAYDPVAVEQAKLVIGTDVVYSDDLLQTVDGCDACVILTEWPQVVKMDLDEVKKRLKQPILIDGRNIFDLAEMEKRQFVYASIGRPDINAYASQIG